MRKILILAFLVLASVGLSADRRDDLFLGWSWTLTRLEGMTRTSYHVTFSETEAEVTGPMDAKLQGASGFAEGTPSFKEEIAMLDQIQVFKYSKRADGFALSDQKGSEVLAVRVKGVVPSVQAGVFVVEFEPDPTGPFREFVGGVHLATIEALDEKFESLERADGQPNKTLHGTPGNVPSSSTEPEVRRP